MKTIRLMIENKEDREKFIIILAHLKCQVWVEETAKKSAPNDEFAKFEYWVCFRVPELNIKDN